MTKTALITGAARRIGRTIAEGLIDRGWNLALHYHHSGEEAQKLSDYAKTRGQQAILLKADLADAEAVSELIPCARQALGDIQLLINNASLFERDQLTDLTTALWDTHLNINLRAPAFLMRDFATQFSDKPLKDNQIINLIDQRVWRLNPDFTSYMVSKAGLWTLTQTAAQALAPHIRVNAIGPGPTLPNPRQSQADFNKQAALVPLQRATAPTEIMAAICYLINAPSVTGQMIALDGGQHLAWQTPDVTNVKE